MISLEDNFNQVSLHNPSKDILSIYQGIDEILEYDPRGYKMVRPLFSHSDIPRFLGVDKINYNEFDWNKDEVSFIENKDQGIIALQDNVLGPSSASLQLRLDFREFGEENIPDEISYIVYWKGAIKNRVYSVKKDKESVDTSFGTYEAYKVSRKFNDESDRSQVFWLAPDLDYSVRR